MTILPPDSRRPKAVIRSDLPSIRACRPFADSDLLADAAGDHLDNVLHGNATAFYRL